MRVQHAQERAKSKRGATGKAPGSNGSPAENVHGFKKNGATEQK
jgi:hypothetical protein